MNSFLPSAASESVIMLKCCLGKRIIARFSVKSETVSHCWGKDNRTAQQGKESVFSEHFPAHGGSGEHPWLELATMVHRQQTHPCIRFAKTFSLG